jgi:RNA polymerase sigma-70 factor (ECF subfamily)
MENNNSLGFSGRYKPKPMTNSADQFEAIVSEYYEPLFRFAMSLAHAESDAQDLTQQTFYIWATKGHQLRDLSRIKTWLYTTLHRTFLQTRRRQIRFPHHELDEVSEQLPNVSPPLPTQLDSAEALSALAHVDQVYQAAVALFYLNDCSYKDIAVILEIPIGTVKSRIARGIMQLRKILLPDCSSDAIPSLTNIGKAQGPRDATPPPLSRHARTTLPASNYSRWDFNSTSLRQLTASL